MKHLFSLLSICMFKMKSKHFYLQELHQNTQLQILIQANITMGKKLKTCQERPHLFSGHFIKVFYKTTTCPDDHFWVVPKVVILYRFDCTYIFLPNQPWKQKTVSGRLIQVWLYFYLSSKLILETRGLSNFFYFLSGKGHFLLVFLCIFKCKNKIFTRVY